MDFDSGMVTLIVKGGVASLREAERFGVNAELMRNPAAASAFAFIKEYAEKHDEMPGFEIVTHRTGVKPVEVGANIEHVAAHMRKRHLWVLEKEGMKELMELMEDKNAIGARERIIELANQLQTVSVGTKANVKNLFQSGPKVLERYRQTASGEIGVPLPWDTMNRMSMGLWAATVSLFLARPGTGKTFAAIIAARHAWLLEREGVGVPWGKGQLIVSPEMDVNELGERFFSIDSGVSYKDLVGGELGEFNEAKLEAIVEKRLEDEGIWVIDDPNDLKPDIIEEAIMDLDPAAVWIDSAYDIQVGRGNRQERAPAVSEWLKNAAKRTGKPFGAASQLNQSGTTAMSDQLNWDAHNIFFMEQTEDMRDDRILDFVPKKVRRAAHVRKFRVRWDFEAMDFEEIDIDETQFQDKGFSNEPDAF